MHHYNQGRRVQEDLEKLSEYVTKPESLPFIQEGFPVKVSPKVNKNRLCFNMTRFPGETTTVSEQTLCTWLLAALHRRTKRTRTVDSEGKQQKKHSDSSPLLRKREMKFSPLGLQRNWLDSLMQIKSSTFLNADWRKSTNPCQDQTGLF